MSKFNKTLTLRVFFLIVTTDILESFAELFFKKGTLAAGINNITFSNFFEFAARMLPTYGLWIGVFLYILNFFVWITVLSKIDLSLAFPLASTSYIFVPLLSAFFLHENVSFLRWSGIALIVIGIIFLTRPKGLIRENK